MSGEVRQVGSLETCGIEVVETPGCVCGELGPWDIWQAQLHEELVFAGLAWLDNVARFGKEACCDGYTVAGVMVHQPGEEGEVPGLRVDLHNVRRCVTDEDFEEQWSVVVWPRSYRVDDRQHLDRESLEYRGIAWQRFLHLDGSEVPPFVPNR